MTLPNRLPGITAGLLPCILFMLLFVTAATGATDTVRETPGQPPAFTPLVERYILDELKNVRNDQMQLRADVEQRISRAEVEQTDRAARYVTDTVGNIFYLIAAATSILIFAGWNSLRDIRNKTESIVEERIDRITTKYNEELETLKEKLTQQSKKILDNQNRIYNTQMIHSLWMRAGLEANPQSKIEIYDEILKYNAEDPEAYAYKADAVLDLDEFEWALNLSNKAIEIDAEYGYAYWQRACAHARLQNAGEAVRDIQTAIDKAPYLKDEIANEPAFERIRASEAFQEAIA